MNSMEQAVSNAVNFGVVILNEKQRVVFWNNWMTKLSGLDAEKVLGHSLDKIFSGMIDQRIPYAVNEAINFGMSSILSYTLHPTPLPLYPNGDKTNPRIKQSVEVIPFFPDNIIHCLISIHDVTDAVRREQHLRQQTLEYQADLQKLSTAQVALQRSEMRFRELTRHAPVGLFELDEKGRWTFLNEKCLEILGYEDKSLLDSFWLNILPESDSNEIMMRWQVLRDSEQRFHAEIMFCRPDRRITWLEMDLRGIRNDRDKVVGFIGTVQDVGEQRLHLHNVEHRANHDSLTQVYSRNYFETKVKATLAGAQAVNLRVGFVFIDLDKFKSINDEYGHAAGDRLLKTVAGRMKRILRESDFIGRIGGDEFAIVVGDLTTDITLSAVLAKVRRAITLPVNIGNMFIKIEASIGTAVYPSQGDSLESLLAHADREMYKEKQGFVV